MNDYSNDKNECLSKMIKINAEVKQFRWIQINANHSNDVDSYWNNNNTTKIQKFQKLNSDEHKAIKDSGMQPTREKWSIVG